MRTQNKLIINKNPLIIIPKDIISNKYLCNRLEESLLRKELILLLDLNFKKLLIKSKTA